MYKFLNFILDSRQHALVKDGKKLDLGSSAYDLLLYFVKNSQTTLTKDELINNVWANKSVTESTLYKQVQRLRKLLGDTGDHKEIISTVHGVGFVFLPEVVKLDNSQFPLKNQVRNTKTSSEIILVLLTVLLLVAGYFLFEYLDDKQIKPSLQSNTEELSKPFSLAIIPNISNLNNEDSLWMISGGIHYLSEMFDSNQIAVKTIEVKELGKKDPNKFAIELNSKQLQDASILFDISKSDEVFKATIKIRNEQGVLAEKELSSNSIKLVIDQAALWIKQELNFDEFYQNKQLSKKGYAIESYIRGVSEQLVGRYKSAIQYFELAIKEDNDFWLAWYELAMAHNDLQQNDKALSIIDTLFIKTTNELDLIMLHNAKSKILYHQNKLTDALQQMNYALNLAEKINHLKFKVKILTNKSFIQQRQGDLPAALKNVNESIKLLQEAPFNTYEPLCSSYSSLMFIYKDMNELDNTIEYAKKSIESCQRADLKTFELNSKTQLAYYLSLKGQFKEAEEINLQVLTQFKIQQNKAGELSTLLGLIQSDIILGQISQAKEKLTQVEGLMKETDNYLEFFYLFKKAEVMLIEGKYLELENLIKRLEKITNHNPSYEISLANLKINYFKIIGQLQQWRNEILELNNKQELQEEPMFYVHQASLSAFDNKLEGADVLFNKAKIKVLKGQEFFTVTKVFNPYIEFLVKSKQRAKAESNLEELEKYNPPLYPYLRTKARFFYAQKNNIKAVALLQELKSKRQKLWTSEDQLLLEKYQKSLN